MDDGMERKKLIEYLPPFLAQFEEIKEIMRAEDGQLDDIDRSIQQALNNSFITDCDEYGIKKYETFLSIMPGPEDTLESRKSRVLLRWNEYVPYTYRVLVNRLNAFCGVNNYEITGNLKRYYLHIRTNLNLPGQVAEFEKMCDRIIPMNIEAAAANQMEHVPWGPVSMGGAVAASIERTIN